MNISQITLIIALALAQGATAICAHDNAIQEIQTTADGINFQLGNHSYFANAKHPRRVLDLAVAVEEGPCFMPLTAMITNVSEVTGDVLQHILTSYLSSDDVISSDFFANIYISSTSPSASLESSAIEYLHSLKADDIYMNSTAFDTIPPSFHSLDAPSDEPLAPGPYLTMVSDDKLTILDTYRLFVDEYRDFITGSYASNDGAKSFTALSSMSSRSWAPMIPVPSRLHSWGDPRPLAGVRVAVKDLFDMKGLQTSAGSQAWIRITPIANTTAPAIQRLVDLGAVLVGKYKLAQFASGASPWELVDQQHPFNPRGDGYLTCSGSSSGGGCAVAAYDWLDAAIGSDTGGSVRRPAAVSGTFGNRPSQGMISLEGVVPLNWAQDTAGVFSRDPMAWSKFAKAWYAPELHQPSSITGLAPLHISDTTGFPSRMLYPDEYFPVENPDAQRILDQFVSQMSTLFNMTIRHFNFTATVENATIYPNGTSNWHEIVSTYDVTTRWSQHVAVSEPLMSRWKDQDDGRFPPVDPQWRREWLEFNRSLYTQAAYDRSLQSKAMAVDWFETHLLAETSQSCSESLLLCEIGTGGLPSFREQELNIAPNASTGEMRAGTVVNCATICPLFGCTDFTIPVGQVSYWSPVTRHTEQYPVSINLIARRGCDFMLFNMVEKMAAAGILRAVQTGRQAF